MDLLSKFIGSILQEAALKYSNIDQVKIERHSDFVLINALLKNKSVGKILLNLPTDECVGAFEVGYIEANKGFGPLLYDIAIEYSTQYGEGLVSDRKSVSSSSKNVWNFYMKQRSDVNKEQLDDLKNTLTPSEDDNCEQTSAYDDQGEFFKSSLSKLYTKQPTTINALKKMNKLVIKDI